MSNVIKSIVDDPIKIEFTTAIPFERKKDGGYAAGKLNLPGATKATAASLAGLKTLLASQVKQQYYYLFEINKDSEDKAIMKDKERFNKVVKKVSYFKATPAAVKQQLVKLNSEPQPIEDINE